MHDKPALYGSVSVCLRACGYLLLLHVSVRGDVVGLAGVDCDEVQVGRGGEYAGSWQAPVAEPAVHQASTDGAEGVHIMVAAHKHSAPRVSAAWSGRRGCRWRAV